MKTIKEFIMQMMVLGVFVAAIVLLMEYTGLFKNAYLQAEGLVSHPSIGTWRESE